MANSITTNGIEFVKVNHDVNGNPRYVCHFLNILNDTEQNRKDNYELAIKKAHTLGGRKFHNRQYGGGLVFQSYSLDDTAKRIAELAK